MHKNEHKKTTLFSSRVVYDKSSVRDERKKIKFEFEKKNVNISTNPHHGCENARILLVAKYKTAGGHFSYLFGYYKPPIAIGYRSMPKQS